MLYFYVWLRTRVTISARSVECVSTFGPTIVHRAPLIFVVHARLMPPGVLLRDTIEVVGERDDRGYLCPWGIERLRTALIDAGFVVRDRRAWIPSGGGSPWLPRWGR